LRLLAASLSGYFRLFPVICGGDIGLHFPIYRCVQENQVSERGTIYE